MPLVICRYRYANRGAIAAGFNIKLAAEQLRSLVHARDANSETGGKVPIPFPKVSGNSAPFVAYLQCDLSGVTLNSYLGSATSRMPLDIRQAFLNNPEKSQLDMWLHPSETPRYLQFNCFMDTATHCLNDIGCNSTFRQVVTLTIESSLVSAHVLANHSLHRSGAMTHLLANHGRVYLGKLPPVAASLKGVRSSFLKSKRFTGRIESLIQKASFLHFDNPFRDAKRLQRLVGFRPRPLGMKIPYVRSFLRPAKEGE